MKKIESEEDVKTVLWDKYFEDKKRCGLKNVKRIYKSQPNGDKGWDIILGDKETNQLIFIEAKFMGGTSSSDSCFTAAIYAILFRRNRIAEEIKKLKEKNFYKKYEKYQKKYGFALNTFNPEQDNYRILYCFEKILEGEYTWKYIAEDSNKKDIYLFYFINRKRGVAEVSWQKMLKLAKKFEKKYNRKYEEEYNPKENNLSKNMKGKLNITNKIIEKELDFR